MNEVYILWVYPPPLAGEKYIGGIYAHEAEAGVDMTDRYAYVIKPAALITKGE